MEMEKMKSTPIPAIDFCGKRKAVPGESEYLKGLMLDLAEGHAAKGSFLVILFLMAVLPWIGIIKLAGAVRNRYDLEYLQFSDVAVECIVCVVLFLVGIWGIYCFIHSIKDCVENTYQADVLEERFCVVDVEVTEWHKNSDLESAESLVNVKDCEGNVAEKMFTTVNWQEIKKTQKGVIVIFEKESGENSVLYSLFPRYDEKSSFCVKMKESYLRNVALKKKIRI